MTIVYMALAIIPSVLIGFYLYKKDFNKEPKKLLVSLFFGGIGSAFLTYSLSTAVNSFIPGLVPSIDGTTQYTIVELFIKVLLGVALIEEFSKWFFAYYIGYKSKEFDEVYDIILYCGFVALGFATFENVLYVFTADNTMQTALLRAVTAVPGHVCDAVLMGYYLGIAKQYEVAGNMSSRKKYLILAVFVPTLSHGIYDFLIMAGSGILVLVWLVFIVLMYIYVIKKLREVSKARKTVYQPVSNMPSATTYFNQMNQGSNTTFGQNSFYNSQVFGNKPVFGSNQVVNNQQNMNNNVNQNNNNNNNYAIKYCPNCGNFEPDANFCSQCGSKIR